MFLPEDFILHILSCPDFKFQILESKPNDRLAFEMLDVT